MNAPALVVIGASAGGVEALIQLTSHLPKDLPAVILIVVHVSSSVPSFLPQVLRRKCKLPVSHARNGEPMQRGQVYIAPPNHHMRVQDGKLRLTHGPRQNGHRPAIDQLFETAAQAHQQRVIGIILSGMLDDGARGLRIVKSHGGMAVVQSPKDATFDSMPNSAIARTAVDHVLPAAEIGERLPEWISQMNALEEADPPMDEEYEREFVQDDKRSFEEGQESDNRSMLTCPECGGVLWEMHDGGDIHYRCHVGHVYSIESLHSDKDETLERALWVAVRALEENASLARRMASRARESNRQLSVKVFDARAREHAHNANLIRGVLEHLQSDSPAALEASENGLETQPVDPDAPGFGA
jgi:two-component system chemotaxis response regulator CheB